MYNIDDSLYTEFTSNSIDLCAYIFAVTGRSPSVSKDRSTGSDMATFTFRRTPELLAHVEAFATGQAIVNASRLLSARRYLWNEARRLKGVRHE